VGEGSHADHDGAYEQLRALRWAVEAFSARREALGPEVEICVDFHQRTTPAYAMQLARELAPMRPFVIEDPVRAENPAQFAHLRQHIWVPIATGEQISSKAFWPVGGTFVVAGGTSGPSLARWRARMVEVQPSFRQ
jgi:L-alanine-DL-glutamate epimerase-like enolase superfamily enzyme